MMIKGFVKKEDVFKVIAENNYIDRMTLDCYDRLIQGIGKLPTVKERQKGKWIDNGENYVECPFCHALTNCDDNKDELRFCFNCGAEMREERTQREAGKKAGEKANQDVLMPLA